jgi:hypothetical protein
MSFDLNIGNYKMTELEDIFELPKNYNKQLVLTKEGNARKKIQSDSKINETVKKNTIQFLIKAKDILIANCSNEVPSNGTNTLFNGALFNGTNTSFGGSTSFNGTSFGGSTSFNGTSFGGSTSLDRAFQNYFHDTSANASSSAVVKKNISTLSGENGSFIIEKPKDTYVNSNQKPILPGEMNPLLNTTTIKKYLNVDTRFRENYYGTLSSNFGLNLPVSMNNTVSLRLSAVELPKTFYAVSRIFGSDHFSISRSNVVKHISVPDGNYDPIALCTYLTNYMDSLGWPFTDIQFLIDIRDNNGSGRIIVSLKENPSSIAPFALSFQQDVMGADDKTTPLPLKLGWKMGFRNGMYENNVSYVSEGIPDLSGPKYLYLAVDDFNNNVNNGFYSAFSESVMNNNILARISMSGASFDDVQESSSVSVYTRQYFGPVNINKLQIQLLDEYGRTINLNNMDYSFCLEFQIIYDL